MSEIIHLGTYWGYTEKRCKGCEHLEESDPMPSGTVLVACDVPDGKCIKDGSQVYGE